VITDPEPIWGRARRAYVASDARSALTLPPADPLRERTRALVTALDNGTQPPVWRACTELAAALARFYVIASPDVRVLGVRPHEVEDGVCTYQLFGDYTPETERIRVWMRTAIRTKVTSPKALLNTLLHEFCHHLDAKLWRCPESPHTRGFFGRVDRLYHHALGTPAEARRPLYWVKSGRVWRLDWRRSRIPGVAARAGESAAGERG